MITIGDANRSLDVAYEYQDQGSACVVCLHGLQSNKEAFADVVKRCAREKFSTLTLDFVGFGRSSRPESFSYKLEDQCRVVAEILNQLRLQKFFLIGHSMGGMVGTMLLEQFRKQLLGFINMEGNFVLADCGASLQASELSFEEFSSKYYPHLKLSLETSEDPSAPLRKKWLASTADYAFYRTSQSIAEWSRSEKLLPMYIDSTVRKLFVYGEQNRRKRDVLPTSEHAVEIPHAGHFMLADNPQATLEVIDRFLMPQHEQ